MARYELRNMVKQTVMLSLTGSTQRFPFVIDAATPSVTVLHPTEPESKRFAVGLPSGAALTLGAGVSDGYLVANARVEHWSAAARILTVSNASSVEVLQRRSVYRVPASFGVLVGVERRGGIVFAEGRTADISERGLAATVKGLIVDAGEPLALSVQLRNTTFMAVARVVVPGDAARLPIRMQLDQLRSADQSTLAAELRQAELSLVRTAPTGVGRG